MASVAIAFTPFSGIPPMGTPSHEDFFLHNLVCSWLGNQPSHIGMCIIVIGNTHLLLYKYKLYINKNLLEVTVAGSTPVFT